ncbi:MAG: glycosyltransferase [Saprospiraceae bacterium]|nr:glycosyltransferase [Saprospiraceae bacterium]
MENSNTRHQRILILPSWYPNRDHQIGSFFQEQAQFLDQNGFEVKVLMGQQLHTKNSLYHRIKRWLRRKPKGLSKAYLNQNPEAFSFPIILQNNWSEERQYRVANNCYLNAYSAFCKKHWTPDIIHVQGTFRAGFSAEKICEAYAVPYVIMEHSPFKLSAFSPFKKEKIKSALMNATKVGAVSQYQKKRMKEDGIDREIDVIWNLMDEERFRLKDTSQSSKFVISTVTTPNKVKDVLTFFRAIAAFANSLKDRDQVEVVVVGNNVGSTDTSYYEKHAGELNILDLCTFNSYMDRKAIEILMKRSTVFISTSLDEPYGVAIREAMLCGTTVISTRSGGPEDSINEETGVLVDIGDYKDIAKHLKLIKNETLRFDKTYIRNYIIKQAGQNAFLQAMKKFYSLSTDYVN